MKSPSHLHLLLYSGATFTEVAPLLGFPWTSRTTYGDGAVRTSDGLTLLPDEPLEALGNVVSGAVVIPGGDPSDLLEDPVALAILARELPRLATRDDVTLGAICNGALLLARVGLLDGRRCTHTAHAPYATAEAYPELMAFAESFLGPAVWCDEDVVIDGRIVTAKPWAALTFAKVMARAAGQDRPGAASRARYLGGRRDAPGQDPYERYVIELSALSGTRAPMATIEAHVAWLRTFEAVGALELAGPLAPSQPGELGSGLVVIRAGSLAEAEALAATDPFVTSGVRMARVRRWQLSCDDNGHMLP
ncbi:MAG: DJ-1/PfpI family protein [Myxococcales bacterium]|nr:DJ-1/PfpI family protein [Myxococcales bacterium]